MDPVHSLTSAAGMLPLLLFCLSMTATPGPNNIMLTASGANFGFRRTVPHMLGIICGVQIIIYTIGLGLGRMFEAYPAIHTAMEWVGGGYLLYLAWKIATIKPVRTEAQASQRPMTFIQAMLFQWVNPKCWMMVIGAVATFSSSESALRDIMIIGTGFLVVSPSIVLWALIGVRVRKLLETPSHRRMFNYTMAGLLVGSLAFVHLDKIMQA